jgi:hypothetical protein
VWTDELARLVAASLAAMFLVSGTIKVVGRDGPRTWGAVIQTLLGNRLGRVVGKLLPLAELTVAATLVLAPATGLRLASAMLAVLAGGVLAAARSPLRGTKCTCLGALSRARIGLRLALRNLGLALAAFAASFAAPLPGPLGVGALLIGLGVFLLSSLAPRVQGLGRVRVGSRVYGIELDGERGALIVVLSPGCPPCEGLAPELARFAADRPRLALTVAIGPGAPSERERLATAVGAPARLDLERALNRWTVPATPWAIAALGDGRVAASAPVPTPDALASVVASLGEPPTRHSRRAALRAAAVASVAVPAVRSAVAYARVLKQSPIAVAAGITYDHSPQNDFHGTCDKFGDRLQTGGGVYVPGYSGGKDANGYTKVTGIDDGGKPPASVVNRRDKVTITQKGYCPCDHSYYDSFTQCTIECPNGLGCFGIQCQPGPSVVCIDTTYGVKLDPPDITIYQLLWTPPKHSLRGCKQMAAAINANTAAHEARHAQNAINAFNQVNQRYAHKRAHACAPTKGQALAEINAQIADEIRAAQDEAATVLDAADQAFHLSPAGQHGVLDCRKC